MQVVILAGGEGTRMANGELPKPMIQIGGRPILWHIMKHYDVHDYRDFILCLGYKGNVIRDYFLHYESNVCDVEVNTLMGNVSNNYIGENWNVRLAETGEYTGTAGRIKRVEKYVKGDLFLATYGDSLSDVPIKSVVDYHRRTNTIATMCVMHSSQRFGIANVQDGRVIKFVEKPRTTDWINGGFYVFDRRIFDWLDDGPLEYGPISRLAESGQLAAYEHFGCHRAMDTPRDVKMLNEEWESGNACWKTW